MNGSALLDKCKVIKQDREMDKSKEYIDKAVMTDTEITEKLAKFMGWYRTGVDTTPVIIGKNWWYNSQGKAVHTVAAWNPLENISDAWEIEEHGIKDRGLEVRYCTELRKITGYGDFKYIHATPRERCKACLKVIENGDESHG